MNSVSTPLRHLVQRVSVLALSLVLPTGIQARELEAQKQHSAKMVHDIVRKEYRESALPTQNTQAYIAKDMFDNPTRPYSILPPGQGDSQSADSMVPPDVSAKTPRNKQPDIAPSGPVTKPSRFYPKPWLVIETGMHHAAINRIAVDKNGSTLVTGSDDRTARVWDLRTNLLLRTLRPPSGQGQVGLVSSVAITQSGDLIAIGVYQGPGDNAIYLYQGQQEQPVRRIGAIANPVLQLVFSRDGKRLLATLDAIGTFDRGTRLYDPATGTQLASDTLYMGESDGADFDASGRAVTSSLDGYIRLYDSSFAQPKLKVKAPSGKEPYAVRFSPDGKRVAVGYRDAARIDVLDADTLRPLCQPDLRGITAGTLRTVAWGQDGSLYIGGQWNKAGQHPVRRFDKGCGAFLDIPVAGSTITDLAALPGGQLAIASDLPEWTILGSDHKVRYRRQGVNVNLLNARLDISSDGQVVMITPPGGGPAIGFSARSRQLLTGAPAESLHPPKTTAQKLTIKAQPGAREVILNQRTVPLDPVETNCSFAIFADESAVILGRQGSLRKISAAGQAVWGIIAPAPIWAVNLSSDGKLVVATLADGTVRWYRAEDGQELLRFFLHSDHRRWIAWTRRGYYDASINGEGLIGWQVNDGITRNASFFSIAGFRDQLNRPDVIERVLFTRDVEKARAEADSALGRQTPAASIQQILPPLVRIVSPTAASTMAASHITVQLAVRSTSGRPVAMLELWVDGIRRAERPPSAQNQGPQAPESELVENIELDLPAARCTLQARARTDLSGFGDFGVAHDIGWSGQPNPGVLRPQLNVLAIGVGKFTLSPIYNLPLVRADGPSVMADDAGDFVKQLEGRAGGYRKFNQKVLGDSFASLDAILDGLDWLRNVTEPGDVAIIYLSGHGVSEKETKAYRFLVPEMNPARLAATTLSGDELKRRIQSIASKKSRTVLFLDTCYAGSVSLPGAVLPEQESLVNNLSDTGIIVFAAASRGENAQVDMTRWSDTAFYRALKKALSSNGAISVLKLFDSISDEVKQLTAGTQQPVLGTSSQWLKDFELFDTKKG